MGKSKKRKKKKSIAEQPGDGSVEPESSPEQIEEVEEKSATADESSSSSRRDFLAKAGIVAVCSCAAGALAGSVRLAVPDFFDGPPERFPLGRPSDFKTGTLTWVREKQLFVLRDEDGFGVFSSRCTHLGCTVRRTAEGFFCPCHGARYDARGQVTHGPARAPLPWYGLWLEQDGYIWVDTGEEAEMGSMRTLG